MSDEWSYDFAFAVDIMHKLNEINTKLHGKCVFALQLHLKVNASKEAWTFCHAAE